MKIKKVFRVIFISLIIILSGGMSVFATKQSIKTAPDQQDTRTTTEASTEDTSEPVQENSGAFKLTATATQTPGDEFYDVTITAFSNYADFSGYVRLSILNTSDDSIEYETKIVLPEKTEKSFSIRIPQAGDTDDDFSIELSLVDEKKNTVYSCKNDDLFINAMADAIYIGVLSSDFSKLSYLDMNGQKLYKMKDELPVVLVELTPDNIAKEASRLTYMVIDDYDTSKLDGSVISQIEAYVNSGGVLYIGTGANEDKSLQGFSRNFIDAEVTGHSKQQTYSYMTGDFIDITVSDINYGNAYYYTSYTIPGMYKREGNGVLALIQISFSDPDFINMDDMEAMLYNSFSDTYSSTGFYYNYYQDDIDLSTVSEYFKSIEGLKKVSVTGLKWIILFYVLIIGPVLYLILKKANKREYFWIAIPVLTMICVGIIVVYGQRYKLSRNNIANVTIASADGSGMRKTYMSVFSSKSGTISVDLKDTINGIGTIFKSYGNYNGRKEIDYTVSLEGGRTRIKHVGDKTFDKGYFVGLSENSGSGKLTLGDTGWSVGIAGTLKNETEYDFDYILILSDDTLVITKGLKAGDKLAVSSNIVYSNYYYYKGDNSEIPERFKDSDRIDYRELAALLLALDDLSDQSDEIIIGITSDYDSFATGDINELSFGCIYSIGTID